MNKEKTTEQEELIDLLAVLRKFLLFLRRYWLMVLLLTALGGGLMCARSILNYRPMYRSEAWFSVSVNYSGSTDLSGYSNYYDRSAAKLVTDTFPYLLRTETMQELIRQKLNAGYINGSISAVSAANTNLFTLTVTSPDPEDAYRIIQAVIDVYPQVSRQVIGETQLVITRQPLLPSAPYNALSWHRNAAVGALAGMALGLSLLLIASLLRKTALKVEDVTKMISIPCLARIPNVKLKQRKTSTTNTLLITHQESDSAFSESFRLLRLKLLRTLGNDSQVILFTSSVPSEGKSSMAVNTALALAKDNKKVLLVDGDLRGPSIKSLLNLSTPSNGLAEYLTDGPSSIQFLRCGSSSLHLFAGDKAISSPTALLRRDKLQELFQSLRPMFDYIIVDTPPCTIMADASVLAPHADKVVYIIREDFASTAQILDGIQSLSSSGVEVCGFVFNRTTALHSGHYGYGYGYGYGYDYGNNHYSNAKKYGYSYSKQGPSKFE